MAAIARRALMSGSAPETRGARNRLRATAFALTAALASSSAAMADESGISFWLPGLYGSLAAVPGTPGFNYTTTYYHASVDANASRVPT